MILADKIIQLRKKQGWSQEELAEKMNVSRQAVSKWESAQTIPDLEKILQFSKLFGVSTDYLLKDEMETAEYTETDADRTVRRVSLEEATAYLEVRRQASWRIALGVLLCILSPVTLIFLAGAADAAMLSEAPAMTVGLTVLFGMVATAVGLFVYTGFQNTPYEFLDKNEPFELSYGVEGILREKEEASRALYYKCNILGIVLCVLSPLPLLISAFSGNEFLTVIFWTVTLALVGIACFLLIASGVRIGALKRLLCEGEFSPSEKKKNALWGKVDEIYTFVLVAIYLAWSFLSDDWHITWIVFAVGFGLLPAVKAMVTLLSERKGKE